MKRMIFVSGCILFLTVGCIGVQVKAPEKPIKVDITMRLDVYQHVQQDIDSVESIVTGSGAEVKPIVGQQQSFLDCLMATAYAQDMDPAVEEAALRRKGRYSEIVSLESQGVLGENSSGMLVVRKSSSASVANMVSEENSDRMLIYRGIAKKNGTSVESVQEVYAERLQKSAPSGTPIETGNGSWQTK